MKLIPMRTAAKLARTVALLLTASALSGLLMSLTGCGGGGAANSKSATNAGRFVLTVKWPAPTRLIPAASGSINAVLTSGGTTLGHQLLVRPTEAPWTTVVTFDRLNPGAVTLSATAYPTATGTGVAQAAGSIPATITAGAQTSVTVNMASTIDHLALTPTAPTVAVGATTPLTETAFDVQGNIVLTAPQNISWLSATTATATVDGTGITTGVQSGTSLITVTESESGKSASTTLTVTGPAPAGPSRTVIDPTGKFVYVSNNLTKTLSQFKINTDGTLSPLTPATVAVPQGPFSLAVNPASGGHTLYVTTTDDITGGISQFNINTDGTLTPLSPASVAGLNAPISLLVDPAGKYLYEISFGNGIRPFRIQADGTLIQNGPDFISEFIQYHAGAIAPDGKTLYVSGGAIESIRIEHVNTDGTLTNIGSVNDYGNMTVVPSGPYLIAYGEQPSKITTYLIGATGSLTKMGSAATSLTGFVQSTLTPNGKYLYLTAGSMPNSIGAYAVNTDGSLTALSPATVFTGNLPYDITMTPDGKFLYVVNYTDNSVSQFKINADGTLTPLTPATIPG